MTSPVIHLTEPVAAEPIPAELDVAMHLPDYISLGHWAMEFAAAIGLPSTAEISTWVAGDWEKVARAADACRKLGEFNAALGAETSREITELGTTWSGSASDAARGYFDSLAGSLSSNASAFTEIGRQLDSTAVGVHQSAKLIGDQFEDLIDLAIVFGIEAAAAAVTAPTGA